MSAAEKIAALQVAVRIARRDAEDCAEAKLFADAERARQAAAWALDMIEEIAADVEGSTL